jgi:putative ABC transport system substrate-binding protein
MDSRRLIATVAFCLLIATAAVDAQRPGRIPRIGALCPTQCPGHPLNEKALLPGLREHGWVAGQNIAIEYRNAQGQWDRLPALAAELVALEVDILVAPTQGAAEVLKKTTTAIPIVFVGVSEDPVATGLVTSLARPGGNMTGITLVVDARIEVKRLALLKEIVPAVAHVAVLYDPADPHNRRIIRELEAAAGPLRVKLQLVELRGPEHLESAFGDMKRARAGALHVLPTPVAVRHQARIAELALQSRLPATSWTRQFAEAGGLMAYGPNAYDIYRRGAYFIDRILRGAKAADLPVEQPSKFELVINARSARALGLTIPSLLLSQAEQVID